MVTISGVEHRCLEDKAVHIAYALLSCGCSMIENQEDDISEALAILEEAGKILSDAFKFSQDMNNEKDYNLLIVGMALYTAKQYSQAFIIVKDVEVDFTVGQMIISFIKKDFRSLTIHANKGFFEHMPKSQDFDHFNNWVISHEIARCFNVIIDFINLGDRNVLALVKGILDKLLIFSAEENLILYWTIIRLLKIIITTFELVFLWTVLPPLIPEKNIAEKYIRLLSGFKSPVLEMWHILLQSRKCLN